MLQYSLMGVKLGGIQFGYALSATLCKSATVGLYGKPRKTNPVGGASCPAVMALETAETFSMVNQKDQMVKISPDFLQHLIDTVCYTT